MKLILLAFVIAIPACWLVMSNWLSYYAYHTALSPWIFAFAGLLAVVIAFATISVQAMKAALANPVKSLRTE